MGNIQAPPGMDNEYEKGQDQDGDTVRWTGSCLDARLLKEQGWRTGDGGPQSGYV